MTDATTRSTQPLAELRSHLLTAQNATDAPAHAALIAVLSGLLNHVERQSALIDSLCSDLAHKQGIVTRIESRLIPADQDNEQPPKQS